jgi:hypothetical protein
MRDFVLPVYDHAQLADLPDWKQGLHGETCRRAVLDRDRRPGPGGVRRVRGRAGRYGVRFAGVSEATPSAGAATVALNFTVLAAAIASVICGVIALVRSISVRQPGLQALSAPARRMCTRCAPASGRRHIAAGQRHEKG